MFASQVKNCTVHINDDSVFEPEEEFQVHLGTPLGDHWSGAMVGASDIVTITITNDEDGKQAPHKSHTVDSLLAVSVSLAAELLSHLSLGGFIAVLLF